MFITSRPITTSGLSEKASPAKSCSDLKSVLWNPWHGCHKLSEGCKHCYVYRGDAKRDVDSTVVTQTKSFDVPIRRKRNEEYKIASGTLVYTCFTSDFFVEDADKWRSNAWMTIRQRSDLHFLMITKRIDRLARCLPEDWCNGYDNVTICCTVENQSRADYRLPIYRNAPIKHKIIICEPLLERIDLRLEPGCYRIRRSMNPQLTLSSILAVFNGAFLN